MLLCVECDKEIEGHKNKRYCDDCLKIRKIATARSWIYNEKNRPQWLRCMCKASKKWSDNNPEKVKLYREKRKKLSNQLRLELLPTNCKLCNAPIVSKNINKKWCDNCRIELNREYSSIYSRHLKLK